MSCQQHVGFERRIEKVHISKIPLGLTLTSGPLGKTAQRRRNLAGKALIQEAYTIQRWSVMKDTMTHKERTLEVFFQDE